MTTEVRVPTLGESVTEATVASWFKKPGEEVSADEVLCELETDKVSVEVPAPAAGTLGEISAHEGQTVGVDALLATIEEGGAGAGANGARRDAGADDKEQAAVATTAKTGDKSAAEPAPSGEGESVDVAVPTLGESVTEATVSTWFKKAGEAVAVDEVLCELETDKVAVEVPAPAAGTLAEVLSEEGSTVEPGAVIARISAGAGAPAEATGTKDPDAPGNQQYTPPPKGQGGTGTAPRGDVEDAPSAKRAMAEAGLSRDDVEGSGRDGRIMKEDVARAQKQGGSPSRQARTPAPAAPAPADDQSREKRVKMTRLRQTIARRLKEAQNTAAMLTTYNEVDMTGVMEIRKEFKDVFEKKHGVKLGFMSFFVKACTHALLELPAVNAEIDGDEIVYKNFAHIGVAVGTPNGLVVPVVRDAHEMSFATIEKTIAEYGVKARDGKLSMAEMQGGTFTISNGGVYGSLMSSPILNPPQSAILGMHKIQERPMVMGGEIKIRPMMYLALSYDHRIIDGKEAVTFLVRVKESLEDPRRLLMDL
ncbi:MAG: 2-oxoglutarate dehydrogenase complex dihydrolipoyllysine-residue succinyltransferase [Pseudomonadota bacterium]